MFSKKTKVSYILLFLVIVSFSCNTKEPSWVEKYAANESVAQYMENFEGRGELTDPQSKPTDPIEALDGFEYPNDLTMDLVLSEPEIHQPLQISFDHRGRLWVIQYNQYPYPEGLKITEIDNHIRVRFDKKPEAPPSGIQGADKITFFEDTNGDGHFDKATDAITGLNIVTAMALGRGNIWVLNPPYLLAYPDKDGDGIPDGDPVVHLEGFGLEDTHAVANSLTWGPDGWLYGAQGSTTTASIQSSVSKNVAFLGQAIWRYHPETMVFELFAEGGGNNPFNVEMDSKGRIYSGSNGTDRGPYYKQGAYYIKSWGKHGPLTNPYAFGYLPNMPLDGENIRFTHSLIKYEGAALPEKYHDKMFAINPLHNYIQLTKFIPEGSSFQNLDEGKILTTKDKWFRPVDIKAGPDGAIYLADWYDSRLSHVDPRDTWHKNSGRIYRLKDKNSIVPKEPFDLTALGHEELIQLLSHENKWFRQQALRQFGDRKYASVVPALIRLLDSRDGQAALEGLWAIHLSGGFSDEIAIKGLDHKDPFVRMWTVRLLGDANKVSAGISEKLSVLASKENHPEVRSQLASSAKRLPAKDALPLLKNLLLYHNDEEDPDIPLLIWWALESKVDSDSEKILQFFEDPSIWKKETIKQTLLSRLMQRWIMDSEKKYAVFCTKLLALAPTPEDKKKLIEGLQDGLLGTDQADLPEDLMKMVSIPGAGSEVAPLTIPLRQGSEGSIEQALAMIEDPNQDAGLQLTYIRILGEINQEKVIPELLRLVENNQSRPIIQQAAIHALQAYTNPEIGIRITKAYPNFRGNTYVREAAITMFACRKEWTKIFLQEIEKTKIIHKEDVPNHLARNFLLLGEAEIDAKVQKLWPEIKSLSASEKKDQINQIAETLRSGTGDPVNGRVHYLQHCGSCHRLHGEGGDLGPELTGYDRSDPGYLLLHTIDPNADIREGYELVKIETTDGRILGGKLKSQSGNTLVIQHPLGGKPTTLPSDRVKSMQIQQVSYMPERLLESISQKEILDLFTYLMKDKGFVDSQTD